MRELKSLISYFLTKSPHELNKTEITKMIYLFEYYYVQTFGKQFTTANFIRYHYGPYASEIDFEIDGLVLSNYVDRTYIEYPNQKKAYLHSPKNNDLLSTFPLDAQINHIADKVIEELSNKSYDNLINVVYSTPPMVRILYQEELSNSKQLGRELDMKENNYKKYETTKEKLVAAKKRRLERENIGTDEEYFKCIASEYEELEPIRSEATIWCQ